MASKPFKITQQKSGYKGRLRSTVKQRALGSSVAATAKSARGFKQAVTDAHTRYRHRQDNERLAPREDRTFATRSTKQAFLNVQQARSDHAERKSALGRQRKELGKTGQGGRLAVKDAGHMAKFGRTAYLRGKRGGLYTMSGGIKLYVKKK